MYVDSAMTEFVPEMSEENLDDLYNKERVRMHRQLYSAISHDLKTPLASMIVALEIHQRMKERLTPEKQEALISTALQEAYRLDHFITNILDMGKLENGMVTIRSHPIEVGKLLNDCVRNFDIRLKGASLTIVPLNQPLTLSTDAILLCRVVTLLLDNAVKYGGKPPVIRISYEANAESQCLIHIADNGPGIPGSHKDSIFSKYTRFVRRDQQQAGTGLGLAISREIMALLGGSVSLGENNVMGGAVFTLAVPIDS